MLLFFVFYVPDLLEVGVNCAKHLSMNFLEMKHRDSGGFVQQVDKVCVDEVLLALVVGAGGCVIGGEDTSTCSCCSRGICGGLGGDLG